MQNTTIHDKKTRFGWVELAILEMLWKEKTFTGKQIELADMFGTRKQIVNQSILRLEKSGLIKTRKMLHTRCKKITLVEGGSNE